MKKLFAAFLALIMCILLVACNGSDGGKKAFKMSQSAYDDISAAYEMVEKFGSDVYEAWRLGIYDDDEKDFGLAYMAKKLSLSEDELKAGFAYYLNEDEWETMSDEEKQEEIDLAEARFQLGVILYDSVFSLCVDVVTSAYEVSGKAAEIQEHMDSAKKLLQQMSERYSNYEHLQSLKSYYTTTSSFFEFCKDPTGSFEQIKTTVNDYRNDARKCRNDLSFIFAD